MSANKWVYEVATGKWMLQFRDPSIYLTDQINYGLADLGDNQSGPDPILERFDATTGRRAATPTEIAESRADLLASQSKATSRKKDILAMCALVVRARGIAAWNAMTTPQKVTAALNEADVWANIRDFIENNT